MKASHALIMKHPVASSGLFSLQAETLKEAKKAIHAAKKAARSGNAPHQHVKNDHPGWRSTKVARDVVRTMELAKIGPIREAPRPAEAIVAKAYDIPVETLQQRPAEPAPVQILPKLVDSSVAKVQGEVEMLQQISAQQTSAVTKPVPDLPEPAASSVSQVDAPVETPQRDHRAETESVQNLLKLVEAPAVKVSAPVDVAQAKQLGGLGPAQSEANFGRAEEKGLAAAASRVTSAIARERLLRNSERLASDEGQIGVTPLERIRAKVAELQSLLLSDTEQQTEETPRESARQAALAVQSSASVLLSVSAAAGGDRRDKTLEALSNAYSRF